jgi:uncharacterized tellurite resistance protein B-like protein
MTPNVAKALLVSKVLVADGMMSEDERAFLAGLMDRLGLTADERRRVVDLEGWDAAEPVIRALPDDDRRAMVAMLIDAAGADGRMSGKELAVVQQVAAALGVDA